MQAVQVCGWLGPGGAVVYALNACSRAWLTLPAEPLTSSR